MISNEQKNKIEANIKHLDYLDGTGILNTTRKRLVNEFFVFVGAGGTGKKALVKLKKTLKNQVEYADIQKQVMYLSIDTDWDDTDTYVRDGDLLPGEVLKIPYEDAHANINPDKIIPQTAAWVHEDLWAKTGGAGADVTPPDEMNGTGAGGIRQCGRVLFTQSTAQNELYKYLLKVKDKLAKMGGSPKIKVIFLAGIAGGTGSGTVVDLAYLCRHYLKNILATAYKRVNFSAYLFLPSGCGEVTDPTDALIGNQNAYAALKEIDYYMTISNRDEKFEMDYGTPGATNVSISEDIFDFCTLVEGIGNNGHFFENNAETARQIVADSILNMICANANSMSAKTDMFMVDSFLSNQNAKVTGKIKANSDRVWPRDTNYIYSVIGYSSCVVPVDLLTVYVAKKIFDEVYRRFRKADQATEDRAAEFLHACGLEIKQIGGVWKTIQKQQLLDDIQAQADAEFKANGPFYMVNLTKEAASLLENAPEDYLHKALHNKNGFMANQEKWARVEQIYRAALAYLKVLNTNLYEVYTYSIKVLKNLIEKNAKLMTDTNEYQNTFGKSFCWSPIDLRTGDDASKAVIQYLDNILSEQDVKRTATKFVDMLCDKKKEWTDLNAEGNNGVMAYNVADEIRNFIEEHLQKCISTTLEEFLVKAYSGAVDAPVWKYDDRNNQVYSDETEYAAGQILSKLTSNASALAAISGMNLDNAYSNVYLTVPEDCKWLYQAMVDQANAYQMDPNLIYKSTAKDRIVLCRLYAGVPAWAFFWTKGAEETYEEESPYTVGLHMDQGKQGTNWAELPNLYPEKLWSAGEKEVRQREAGISQRIRTWMTTAKDLGLLEAHDSDKDYMNLSVLKQKCSAEELLANAELSDSKKYSLKEVLDILTEKKYFAKEKVNHVNMVMTTTDKLEEKEQEEFRFEMACRTMRRLRNKWKDLEETIAIVQELKVLNENRKIVKTIDPELVATFMNAYAWELASYDGRRGYWKNCLGDEVQMGAKLNDKLQKQCAHYHGFQAFAELEKEVLDEFKEKIEELEDNASDEELDKVDAVKADMKDSLKKLRGAKKNDVVAWAEESPFARDGNKSEWPMASDKFVERVGDEKLANGIRKFYDDLIANI